MKLSIDQFHVSCPHLVTKEKSFELVVRKQRAKGLDRQIQETGDGGRRDLEDLQRLPQSLSEKIYHQNHDDSRKLLRKRRHLLGCY